MPEDNLTAALRLAALGLAIFPCAPDKRPRANFRWREMASSDERLIRMWWQRWPDSIPAFDPGRHGMLAVDCDRHGGPDGVEIFAGLARERGDDPRDWPTVETPSTGRHIFFRNPSKLTNRRGALPAGIDVRGLGGFVVAEGATLPDGRSYNPPDGVNGLVDAMEAGAVPDLPDWLTTILTADPPDRIIKTAPAPPAPPASDVRIQRERTTAREVAAFTAALDAESRNVSGAAEGQRNATLNTAAFNVFQMVAAGWGSASDVEQTLTGAALASGLRQPEIARTIASGRKGGLAKPRQPLVDRDDGPDTFDPAGPSHGRQSTMVIDGVLVDPETGEVIERSDVVEAAEFIWCDPCGIPPRRWLYNRHMIRGFVSATVAPGGVGKSALTMCEGLAIATGKPLLDVVPDERCPVWIMNLEDPVDELYRRTMAIALYYGLSASDLDGSVFLNSGREKGVIIATTTKSGVVIARPVVEAIKRQVFRHRVGLIVVDPFVSSHAVPENDNPAINAVVSAWRDIAEETGCAVELVHHTRKTGGGEVTVEDGRGGSALHGAVRSMRAINGMTRDEAAQWGLENHRLYFRSDAGKANLAPASDRSEWHHLASVDLGNATPDRPSDHVGVVTRWTPPDAAETIVPGDLEKILETIRGSVWRYDVRCDNWAGYAVCQALNLDQQDMQAKKRAAGILAVFLKTGALKIEMGQDNMRRPRQFVVSSNQT